MPTTVAPATIRPLGTPPARPAERAARPTTLAGVLGLDGFTPSRAAAAHPRFAGHAELEALRRPGAAPLGRGATGPAVAAVQQALIDMGFAVPAGAEGNFGPQTTQAVRNLQVAAGLPATGAVDAATFAALERHAPAPGRTAWDPGAKHALVPSPKLPGGGVARVVVGVGQHRAFLFDAKGKLVKIYGVRTGNANHPDGRGSATMPGLKVINAKVKDPSAIATELWPESQGRAFGTRLLALSDVDPRTRRPIHTPYGGQELHGTYQANTIGRDASHGCVGVTNADIEEIFAAVGQGQFVRFDP